MDTVVPPSPALQAGAFRPWLPRRHGAWAMLAVPFLLGIAATRPTGWHFALGGAAVAVDLASATVQAWARAPARGRYAASLLVYESTATVLSAALAVTHPGLCSLWSSSRLPPRSRWLRRSSAAPAASRPVLARSSRF